MSCLLEARARAEGDSSAVRVALHSALKKRNINPEARDPWYFPSDTEYAKVIEAAGLKPLNVSLHPRPTPAHSVTDWIRTFAGHNLLEGLSEEDEKAVVEDAVEEVQYSCEHSRQRRVQPRR